jgi:hypothetical protein
VEDDDAFPRGVEEQRWGFNVKIILECNYDDGGRKEKKTTRARERERGETRNTRNLLFGCPEPILSNTLTMC